jgi:exosome complex RNA-binding protein Rrp42 (RNase PH superfamily)
METKTAFLLQVLEKLAAPMVAAISEVSVRQALIPDPSKPGAMRPEAEQVASLLTKSTQLSIGLANLVDMKSDESEADSIRLALTSLASPLMSNIYRLAGRTPNDSEIQRIADAMSAVVSYSDGYRTAADANVRMSQIDADFFPSDDAQVSLLYMSALLPVVNSIMAYSFGQPEKKLVQDVTERLVRESKFLRAKMFPEIPEGSIAAKADLALLRMAGSIYSQCHFAEMAKLMATEDQVRQGMAPTMTALWQSFILRMQMLEILGDALIPGLRRTVSDMVGSRGGGSSSGGGSGSVKPAVSPPPLSVVPPSASPDESKSDKPSGPMSFFVKKS